MEDAYGRTSAAVGSCCGRFGLLAAVWRRLRRMSWSRRRYRTYVLGAGAGGLNYDPLSYSENFDDGRVCECEPDFLTRFAAARRAGLQLQGAVCDIVGELLSRPMRTRHRELSW